MARRPKNPPRKAEKRPPDLPEATLRARLSLWQRMQTAGSGLIVGAGLAAFAAFPLFSVPPTALSIWTVRSVAVAGFLVVCVALLFDQHYRGELLSRERGQDLRSEVTRASLFVAVAAAVPALVIVALYP